MRSSLVKPKSCPSLPPFQTHLHHPRQPNMAGSSWMLLLLSALAASCVAGAPASGPARCGSQAEYAVCADSMCCNVDGFCGYSKEFCMDRCQSQCVDHFGNSSTFLPSSLAAPAIIITPDVFSQMFPNKHSFYTYESLIGAMKMFPDFASSTDITIRKREIAALMAHIYSQTEGLSMLDQDSSNDMYCDSTKTSYPCEAGKSYHPRGSLKITWNYNYGMASKPLGADILAMPEMVSQEASMWFGSGIWMWMTPSHSQMPSCHQVMAGDWMPTASQAAMGMSPHSFGFTTYMLRGQLECGNQADPSMQLHRAKLFSHFCRILAVHPGPNVDCSSMPPM